MQVVHGAGPKNILRGQYVLLLLPLRLRPCASLPSLSLLIAAVVGKLRECGVLTLLRALAEQAVHTRAALQRDGHLYTHRDITRQPDGGTKVIRFASHEKMIRKHSLTPSASATCKLERFHTKINILSVAIETTPKSRRTDCV